MTQNPNFPKFHGAWLGSGAFFLGAGTLIAWSRAYTPEEALLHDAGTYFGYATEILRGEKGRLLLDAQGASFSDVAYPNLLSLLFELTGPSILAGQFLNALLWGITCAIATALLAKRAGANAAWIGALLFGLSPMLTSFGGKLYSEPLAIFGLVLAVWGWVGKLGSISSFLALSAGAFILITTKSAYFPLAVISILGATVARRWGGASALVTAVVLAYPIHHAVQKGGRGAAQVSTQVAKIQLQPASLILKCSVYHLSHSVGKTLLPEIEGACRLNGTTPDLPMAALNPQTMGIDRYMRGFTYADGMREIIASPFKYALICLSTLPAALWADGYYPGALGGFFGWVRAGLGVFFKILFSSALWVGGIGLAVFLIRRRDPNLAWAGIIFAPVVYTLLFNMNVPPEQRYYMPILPMLYLGNALFWTRRPS